MKHVWFGLGTVLFLAMIIAPLLAQSPGGDDEGHWGPVGTTDENANDESGPEEQVPGWEDLDEETWGPAARVDKYLPHEACDSCFTLPDYDEYTVNEYVESDVEDGAVIIMREIPNPAPEIKAWTDYDPEIGGYIDAQTGERVWFIGTDEYVGPTDEEKWSEDLPVSTIEMKRIKARHLDAIFSIEGVSAFAIGTHGFVVDLLSSYQEESLYKIPTTLEGIPVEVRLTTSLGVLSQHYTHKLRPIPAGVSVGIGGSYGTLGPHVVRDSDTAKNGRCCELLSMTAGHVLNPWNSTSRWRGLAVYSPGSSRAANNRIGTVDYAFTQRPCGALYEVIGTGTLRVPRTCQGSSGIHVNPTVWRPDAGLISYGWKSVPFNNPTGAEPVRRMQYATNSSVRGPSGRTRIPLRGHKHKVWGARTPAAGTGKVTRVDVCENIVWAYLPGKSIYRYCGIVAMDNYRTQKGDSGALVAYKGEGAHYIAGIQFAAKITGSLVGTYYTPAAHIKTALKRANKPISHFWGTYPDYRRPATDDGSG